jgi:hypothetical protein
MSDFKNFINNLALQGGLPFGVTSDLSPDFPGAPVEDVAGFQIPVLDDLTMTEAYIVEAIEATAKNQTLEIQSIIRRVSIAFKNKCGALYESEKGEKLTLAKCWGLIFDPGDDLAESPEYQDFIVENSELIQKAIDLSNSASAKSAIDWNQITFFLMSRLDPNWSPERTGRLPRKAIAAIKEFLIREANGGVIPDLEPAPEGSDEESPNPAPETGKETTTPNSTGK